MRVAVFSDVHGNLTALDAVLDAATQEGAEAFWVVGDLVAHGPQPAATLRRLRELPNATFVRGNTDRYVITGDVPPVFAAENLGPPDELGPLIETMTAHGYTRGCITESGGYDWLVGLPLEPRLELPDGTRVLLVHASPGRDDGPGITADMPDDDLVADGWTSADADLIFVGHTHRRLDRRVGNTRVINPGSVSVPLTSELRAGWVLLDATEEGYSVGHHLIGYDVDRVLKAMDEAHHPSRDWLRSKYGR